MRMKQFKNKAHEEAFETLLKQSEGELYVHGMQDQQKRKQVAFLYLIALYQEDYERYERSRFSVEAYEELSLDGPVYLLEDHIQLKDFPHERMLSVAKDILRGHEMDLDKIDKEDRSFVDIAYHFVRNKNE